MSPAARSVLVFGVYVAGVGTVLVVSPNLLLRVSGLGETHEVWIRVVGVLALVIAAYYLVAARHELVPLMRWSVVARVAVASSFAGFVLLRMVAAPLLGFGAVDLAGAAWTALALRRSPRG